MKDLLRDVAATMGIYDAPAKGGVHGLLAEFPHPGALLDGAKAVREAGYRQYDAHSPFPIHGMDAAMGLGNSLVGFLTLGGALTGLAVGTWLQWWTSAVDYPINISGKPTFAIEPSIPIMFELTILLGALGTVAGMFALNGLPRPWAPQFYSERFARVTDDAFFLYVSASDPRFDEAATAAVLRDAGALHVEAVREHDDDEVAVAEPPAVPA